VSPSSSPSISCPYYPILIDDSTEGQKVIAEPIETIFFDEEKVVFRIVQTWSPGEIEAIFINFPSFSGQQECDAEFDVRMGESSVYTAYCDDEIPPLSLSTPTTPHLRLLTLDHYQLAATSPIATV
jgi:hypothetical protein